MTESKPTSPLLNPHDGVDIPNKFCDEVMLTISPSAAVVYLWLVRHTWGYQNYTEPISVSVDEFVNGRKRSDGSRWSKGCGLSKNAVTKAVKELEQRELLEVWRIPNSTSFYRITREES